MGKKITVEVLVEGGKATSAPPVGTTLGPLKLNIGHVVADINSKTKEFTNMKVPVKVIVNEDKTYTIEVGTPPASQLIKKEINIQKGSGEPNINKVGVISIEQAIKIAKMKKSSLIVNSLKSAVKIIIGSCYSMGVLVDGKTAEEVLKEIGEGKYDEIINLETTETPEAKKKELDIMSKDLAAKTKRREEEKVAAKVAAEAEAAKKAAAVQPQAEVKAPTKTPSKK